MGSLDMGSGPSGAVSGLARILRARALLSDAVATHGGRVVKVQGGTLFAVFDHPVGAVACGVRAMGSIAAHNRSVGNGSRLPLSIGIDAGNALVLPSDVYGNPVNVASKLGEELGVDGSLRISANVRASVVPALLKKSMLDKSVSVVSKVKLVHYAVDWVGAGKALGSGRNKAGRDEDGQSGHGLTEIEEYAGMYLEARDEETKEEAEEAICMLAEETGVVFVSDMSGFTYVSKTKGILHFLSLIYKMRHLLRPLFGKHGGDIIRTAGDDYKAVFVSPAGAVACCLDMMRLLADYNKDLDEAHDQIRIGIGLAYGSFLRLGPPECNVYGAVPDVATDLGEELADPGQIIVDRNMFAMLSPADKSKLGFDQLHIETHATYVVISL